MTICSSSRLAFSVSTSLECARRRRDLDTVLVQGYGVSALVAAITCRLMRVPVIHLVCSPVELYYEERKGTHDSLRRYRRREKWGLLLLARLNAILAQQYVVLSSHLKEVVKSHGGKAHVQVIPIYGVDLNKFRPTPLRKEVIRRRLGLPVTGILILVSSRVAPEKNVGAVLAAAKTLVTEGRDIYLVCLCGGYREIRELARSHDLTDRVIAADAVNPTRNLHRYYQAADVLVQSSNQEGLGFSVLEAFACKLPVIATSVGGLCETVIDGCTGWSVPKGSVEMLAFAMLEAIDDKVETERRTSEALTLVKAHYSSEQAFARMSDLINHVISRR